MTAIGLLGLALQASYQRGLVPAVLVSAALAPLMNAKQATESDAESQLQAAERLHVASSSATSKLAGYIRKCTLNLVCSFSVACTSNSKIHVKEQDFLVINK